MNTEKNQVLPTGEKTPDGKYSYTFVIPKDNKYIEHAIILFLFALIFIYVFGKPLYINLSNANFSANVILQTVMTSLGGLLLLNALKILFQFKSKSFITTIKEKRCIIVKSYLNLKAPRIQYQILTSDKKAWFVVTRDMWHAINPNDSIEIRLSQYLSTYAGKPFYGLYFREIFQNIESLTLVTSAPIVSKTLSEMETLENAQPKETFYTRL